MKKSLTHTPAPRQTRPHYPLTVKVIGGLTLVSLIAGLGLLASRPAHTAGGPIAVSVANTPLATKPTDVAAPQQPFTASTDYVFQNGEALGSLDTAGGYAGIAVPAGKHLVIQTVSLYHIDNNNETIQAYILPTTNGINGAYALPSVPSNATYFPGVTQTMTVYADPGTTVPFNLYRSQSSGIEYVYVIVSGYLVNA